MSLAAAALPVLVGSWELAAAPKSGSIWPFKNQGAVENETRSASPGKDPVKPKQQIKLNFLQANWGKVLKDVAKEMELELVADRAPSKLYTRIDRRAHSRDEALRILNQELEPQGFRLVVKGEYLVLIEVRASRNEYQRTNIPREPQEKTEIASEESGVITAGAVEMAPTKRMVTQAVATRSRGEESSVAPRRSPIRQVAGEKEQELAPPLDAPAEEPVESAVRVKSRDAVTISRHIHKAFKDRSELLDKGPRGLQGFRVYRNSAGTTAGKAAGRETRFEVGIDDERQVLVTHGTPAETRAVSRLIKTLDSLPRNESFRLVSTKKDANQIALTLQPEIDRLTAAGRKHLRRERNSVMEGRGRNTEADDEADGEESDEEAQDQPENSAENLRMGQMNRQGSSLAIVGGLKGEVEIQAIPELGIVIVRGNEGDVKQVMDVINEIERLSVGAAPDVELLMLKHVNSESLATLLTNVYDRTSTNRTAPARTAQSSQSVTVIPIMRPNAVLILASAADMDSVLSLAEELDQPSDPSKEFRVFGLKHAVPGQVVETVEALYPGATTATGGNQAQPSTAALAPRVKIVADTRANTVIVQARPRDMKEVAALIRKLDVGETRAVTQLKMIPLKNAVADELSVTLQTAIQSVLNPARITAAQGQNQAGGQQLQGQTGGAPELREIKSMILDFIDTLGPDGRPLRSGILADIRVSADLRTNTLVVTAPAESMPLLEELVRQLDRPAATVAEIKVFSLANSDATSMSQLLERLFGISTTGQRTGQQGQAGQQGVPGIQVAGADDASSTLIPLRFSVDVRTNSIIGIGGAEALRVVEAVLLRLDESDIRQRQNMVYSLKNTPAVDVANAISTFLQSRNQIEQIDPGLVSPFEQIEREVVVVPQAVGNKLLISATPRYFKDIVELVTKLDEAPKQVIIQALLVEVTLENTDEFGVELGLQDSILFNRSLVDTLVQVPITNTSPNGVQTTTQTIISQSANPGFLFNNTNQLGNNTSPTLNTGRIGGQGISNLAVGRLNTELGYGGLVLSAGSESVNVLLRALSARRRVDVLSRPQIRTLDNQTAQIQVGQSVPIVNGFQQQQISGVNTPQVQYRDIGLILTVTPRISPDGIVVMEVVARKDQLNPNGLPLITNPNGSIIQSPVIDTTNALTSISVRTGQTVVMGGMITKYNENVERKVPILGDIPLVRELFRYDLTKCRKTELLIFLTPRVIHDDSESEMIKQVEAERINFIESEAEAIHGPLFGLPSEGEWVRPGAGSGGETYFHPSAPSGPSVPKNPVPPEPMLMNDPSTPTTLMHHEPAPIPPQSEEDLGLIEAARSGRAVRDPRVTPTEYQPSSGAGRARLNTGPDRSNVRNKAALSPEGAAGSKSQGSDSRKSARRDAAAALWE